MPPVASVIPYPLMSSILLSWKNLKTSVISLTGVVLPTAFSFDRAYPNPFNPVTTLNFGIPVDGNVSIEIYNLQGRMVEVLTGKYMEAGYHSAVWNADSHSSGMYFVQMRASEYLKTQKLMLVK